MKPPRRPRWTTRRLILLVAVAAVCVGYPIELKRRRDRYLALSEIHDKKALRCLFAELRAAVADDAGAERVAVVEQEFHGDLSVLYKEAASRPWRSPPTIEEVRQRRVKAARESRSRTGPRCPGLLAEPPTDGAGSAVSRQVPRPCRGVRRWSVIRV